MNNKDSKAANITIISVVLLLVIGIPFTLFILSDDVFVATAITNSVEESTNNLIKTFSFKVVTVDGDTIKCSQQFNILSDYLVLQEDVLSVNIKAGKKMKLRGNFFDAGLFDLKRYDLVN